MTEDYFLIRCPGCANTNPVTLAVGQQIQCRVCQTYFYAPVLNQGEPTVSETSSTGSMDPLLPPTTDFTRGGPAAQVPQPVFAAGTRSKSTTPAARNWRTDEITSSPAGPAPGNLVPQTAPTASPTNAEPEPDAESLDEEPASYSWIWTTISTVAGIVIVSSSLLLGVHLYREWQAHRPAASDAAIGADAPAATVASTRPVTDDYRWSNAERSALRLEKLELKVLRVKFGAVTAKDLNNEVITTDDQNLLSVNISVHNRGDAICPFRSWYAGGFTDSDGHEQLPDLVDDQGVPYSLLRFDDVSSIEGQRFANEIEPRQAVRDTVVFLIPPECDRSQIRYFHLTLPAHAIGADDFFRLEIPVSMIQGFAPTEPSK